MTDCSGYDAARCATCGDGVIGGSEVCDQAALAGESCESQGHDGGQLGCLANCAGYDHQGCTLCGNGVVEVDEDCDGTIPAAVTCASMGYDQGTFSCDADCLLDLSECSICGDGIRQGLEDCDGFDLGGETCQTQGYDGGNLGCALASCTFAYSGCSGGQYFQDLRLGRCRLSSPPVAGSSGRAR